MARKAWQKLSPAYRKRLERGGISRTAYENGASLSRARGHRATPEHPSDVDHGDAERYSRYQNIRSKRPFPMFIWQDAADDDGNGVPPFDWAIRTDWSYADRFKIARHWHAVKDYDFGSPQIFDRLFSPFRGVRVKGYRFETREGVILKWLTGNDDELADYEDLYNWAEALSASA